MNHNTTTNTALSPEEVLSLPPEDRSAAIAAGKTTGTYLVNWLETITETAEHNVEDYTCTAAQVDDDNRVAAVTSLALANIQTPIELVSDEKVVNDQVIKALADRGDIYDYNGSLSVIQDGDPAIDESRKYIRKLSLPSLREKVAESCYFCNVKTNKEGEEIEILQRLPKWCNEAVADRGYWDEIPKLKRIVNCPVLSSDGSVLQVGGYDKQSGLYLHLSEEFPAIPDEPTAAETAAAVAALMDLVVDFPFHDEASRSGWLASLLTPLAREAYKGCTGPMFAFDANTRGSGKSLLGDLCSWIITGRSAPRLSAPSNDEEARKRITALVIKSPELVMIDNVTDGLGCASIDAALTGETWEDRILGTNEMIERPLRMTWYSSGNNMVFEADTARRVCCIRLESPLENPEDRSDFKHTDIRKFVRRNRRELLAAALTILRNHTANPEKKVSSWGSFDGWSEVVRGAIVAAGLTDPGDTRIETRSAADSEAGALAQLLQALSQLNQGQHGLKAAEMIKIAKRENHDYPLDQVERLSEALELFTGVPVHKLGAGKLGSNLGHFKNRVSGVMKLVINRHNNASHWRAESVADVDLPFAESF